MRREGGEERGSNAPSLEEAATLKVFPTDERLSELSGPRLGFFARDGLVVSLWEKVLWGGARNSYLCRRYPKLTTQCATFVRTPCRAQMHHRIQLNPYGGGPPVLAGFLSQLLPVWHVRLIPIGTVGLLRVTARASQHEEENFLTGSHRSNELFHANGDTLISQCQQVSANLTPRLAPTCPR